MLRCRSFFWGHARYRLLYRDSQATDRMIRAKAPSRRSLGLRPASTAPHPPLPAAHEAIERSRDRSGA
jgi:hypothetical protein